MEEDYRDYSSFEEEEEEDCEDYIPEPIDVSRLSGVVVEAESYEKAKQQVQEYINTYGMPHSFVDLTNRRKPVV